MIPSLRRLCPIAIVVAGVFLPAVAEAIPAFARKYATSCSTCHAGAFPELNAWGRRFKENGYQLPAGAEESTRDDVAGTLGAERLTLLRELPLAVRAQSTAVVPTAPAATSASPLDIRPFESLYLVAGASVYPNVSFLASTTIAPTAAVHHASIGFHNLLIGEGFLNLRVGRLLLLDFNRPEHRSLTRFGHPGAALRVGLNPTALDATHHGVDVYGRLWGRRLFYQLAVVQGAQGADGLSDLDHHKDLFGQLQLTLFDRATLAAFGYLGKTQLDVEINSVRVRFTDPLRIAGVSAEAAAGPFGFFAEALYGVHDNPTGTSVHSNYWSFRGQIDGFFANRWVVIARYDQLTSHHEPAFKQATVHVTYLLLTNLRLSFESTAPLERIDESLLSLRLDLAI